VVVQSRRNYTKHIRHKNTLTIMVSRLLKAYFGNQYQLQCSDIADHVSKLRQLSLTGVPFIRQQYTGVKKYKAVTDP
jgi:hypothetical protein